MAGMPIKKLARAEFGYRTYAYCDGRFRVGELGQRFTWFLLDQHAQPAAARLDVQR